MNRRGFLLSSALAGLGFEVLGPAGAQEAQPSPPGEAAFDFERVIARAAELAAADHVAPGDELVGSFANLGYDQFRGIRFNRAHDPWAGLEGFGLDLLPPGMLFRTPVAVNLVDEGVVRPLPFDPLVFDYDPNGFPEGVDTQNIGQMGWSGFRLRTTLNRPDVLDEFAVFQGASYFRAVSRGTLYGQSARGLAIGTGSAEGEEFPIFREFWIHRPDLREESVRVQALLDSPSIAGAYEFVITPGDATIFATRAALFPRREIADAGITPLTSMYWFGPADRAGIDDFRPAVHDTEGLQITTGQGQALWRVLSSHRDLQLSAFLDRDPRGFGLVQRTRDFDAYQDAEARYDLRPSCWIAARGLWGEGQVALVEIPVQNEFNDNIVAFWQPAQALEAGKRHDFAYDLTFAMDVPAQTPVARVVDTLSGLSVNGRGARSYLIDFDLDAFGADDPQAEVQTSAGRVDHAHLLRLPAQNILRLAFEFFPEGAALADLSAVLNGPDGALSETWLLRWTEG